MEYSFILTSLFFGVFVGYLIGLLHRHRLERSNDKLKATLVKKDQHIANLEAFLELSSASIEVSNIENTQK